MNTISKLFGLLLLPCMLLSMEKTDVMNQLQTTKIVLSFETFMMMLEQEIDCITPYIDSYNGYVELLKKVNAQLLQQGIHIDVSENEFFKETWENKEIQDFFNAGIQEPSKLEIFRHKWRKKIREQLSKVTPIQDIKRRRNEPAEEIIKTRLQANKDIDPNDIHNQEKLRKAKEAIYGGLELEDIMQKSREKELIHYTASSYDETLEE